MKIRNLLLCAVLILAIGVLTACGGSGDGSQSESKPNTEIGGASEGASTADSSSDKVKYTVKLTDEDGNALANVMVQICSESCIPGKTDENGTAVFEVEKAEYKASLIAVPDGYALTTEETNFYFEDKTELVIVLKKQ